MRDAAVAISHAQLARGVVERLAPDETASFELIAQPYLDDPSFGGRAARGRGRGGPPLASGLDLAGALTPTVVVVTGWALGALAQGAAAELANQGARLTGSLLDRFRREPRTGGAAVSVPVAELAPGRLGAVRDSVRAKAEALGVGPDRAAVLADAVVGELALLREENEERDESGESRENRDHTRTERAGRNAPDPGPEAVPEPPR
ncbi:hypothetical protein [Streptomyces sp. NRRL F-5135]|uniref:hypothetical protein n=1 Tax=Streptomyces sp. NRRL F-5135 TaxID=1463858 RepID=UPI000AE7E0BB|nr:hypothetical protein [Streptomyces sp. NRRL F-5135]